MTRGREARQILHTSLYINETTTLSRKRATFSVFALTQFRVFLLAALNLTRATFDLLCWIED